MENSLLPAMHGSRFFCSVFIDSYQISVYYFLEEMMKRERLL